MYQSIKNQARRVSSSSLINPAAAAAWQRSLAARRAQWLEMLGLLPLPQRAPLKAVVTGCLKRPGYVIEKIHFQSLAGAYVPGNLYRPEKIGGRLPAVLYLCGHAIGKASPTYQAHPRWFAQHGYVALILDPIQLGEAQGVHHGTHRLGRWDWISRGYTPAGMEVWNAMRALDYLVARRDVDPGRLGVTGNSGGGAMSWFLGAADERVKCVAPSCQTGSIEQLIADRATDGHCDCAFWINYHQWCTPDLGALIAPRPLLIASCTEDMLWRPYAFRDVYLRIKHQYARLGAADKVALAEDVAPHGYTPKQRRAIFEWFNRHLQDDPRPVAEDVTDRVESERILRVFNGQPPRHDNMRRADELLPFRAPAPPVGACKPWTAWQRATIKKMRQLTFRNIALPARPELVECRADGVSRAGIKFTSHVFRTADNLELRVRTGCPGAAARVPVVAFALPESLRSGHFGAGRPMALTANHATACVEVRNTAATSVGPGYLWTLRRSYPLLGQSLPERQVSDLLDGIEIVRQQPFAGPITLYGEGRTAVLAVYAALLDPAIAGVILADLPASHAHPDTPELPGILRIGDLPQNLALLFPRPITLVGRVDRAFNWAAKVYRKFGQAGSVRRIHKL